jgi:hypothetical protein
MQKMNPKRHQINHTVRTEVDMREARPKSLRLWGKVEWSHSHGKVEPPVVP